MTRRAFIAVTAIAVAYGLGLVFVQKEGERDVRDTVSQAQYQQDVKLVEEQRKSCNRNNLGVRDPLFDFIGTAVKRARREAELTKDPRLRAVNLIAAVDYEEQQQNMVDSAEPVAQYRGAPTIDCQKAFSLPESP